MPRSSQSGPQCAQIADHLAQNTPNSLNFTEVVCTLGASIPNTANMETAARPTGIATASVGGGAWPDIGNDAPSEARSADGERAGRSASITTTPQEWRAPEGPEGRVAGQRADAPGHAQRYSAAGVEGAGGTGGHGRASRRGAERSEALASRAAGPDGTWNTSGATSNPTQRAGGPPPTGTGTPSSPTQRAPGSGYASPETSPATPSPRASRRARPR